MNRLLVSVLSSHRNMFKMSNRTYKVLTSVTVPGVRRSEASVGMTLFSTSSINMSRSPEELKAHQETLMKRGLPTRKSIPGVKHVILVSSGKGGVGKSTTSVNLALALSKHKSAPAVGILDADIFGPSLPTMMNISSAPELTAENKMIPVLNYGIKCMSIGLLVDPAQAVVWRGPMVMGALNKLVTQTHWGHLDILVVDTPPGTGDILLSLAQTINISGAVIVSTPQKVALADARKGIDMFKKVNIPVLGLVENMSVFICGSCGSKTHIFGQDGVQSLAREMGTSVIGEIPLDPAVMNSSDTGKPLLLSHPLSAVSAEYTNLADTVISKLGKSGF